jgi:hypothetical protein
VLNVDALVLDAIVDVELPLVVLNVDALVLGVAVEVLELSVDVDELVLGVIVDVLVVPVVVDVVVVLGVVLVVLLVVVEPNSVQSPSTTDVVELAHADGNLALHALIQASPSQEGISILPSGSGSHPVPSQHKHLQIP